MLKCWSVEDRSSLFRLLQSCVSVGYDNRRFSSDLILFVFKALTRTRNA